MTSDQQKHLISDLGFKIGKSPDGYDVLGLIYTYLDDDYIIVTEYDDFGSLDYYDTHSGEIIQREFDTYEDMLEFMEAADI